ncbi:MAG: SDR family oxidoreductase [Chitinispirillaceae bacterium]|nr:SDR family oxidoreductase [Chitinispirillaceae bacterium]
MDHTFPDDLKGKCCVITGGAGVIGCALVEALARAGVKTGIIDLNGELAICKAKEIADSTGGKVIGIAANVLEKASLFEAKKTINDALGPVDLLINAAGGNSPKATTGAEFIDGADIDHLERTFFGLDLEGFRTVFDLNFMGTLLTTMVFARDMVERNGGAILNISSMNSFRPLTRIPAYSAAKASINNFTAWLAVHLARRSVRVNAIAPGFFLTEQNRFLLYEKESGSLSPRGRKIINATPMQRFGTPDELQDATLFLLSNRSKFITGTVLPIDGGFSAYSGV